MHPGLHILYKYYCISKTYLQIDETKFRSGEFIKEEAFNFIMIICGNRSRVKNPK